MMLLVFGCGVFVRRMYLRQGDRRYEAVNFLVVLVVLATWWTFVPPRGSFAYAERQAPVTAANHSAMTKSVALVETACNLARSNSN